MPFVVPIRRPRAEPRQRRAHAVTFLMVPLLVTALQLLFWRDGSWSYIWKQWVVFGGVALYWLWLSTPRLGSSRFESVVTDDAPRAVLLAFLLGVIFALFML